MITYQPPPGSGPKGLVTHRIVKIGQENEDRQRVYRTKGDANATKDPWTFTLPGKQQPRVVAGVPKAGFVLAALAERNVRMLIVGFPALLIAIFVDGRACGATPAARPPRPRRPPHPPPERP